MRGQTKAAVLVAVVVLAVLGTALVFGQSRGTEFSAFFKDAKMLKAGDPLVQSGIAIGKVVAIKPGSDGRIEIAMRVEKKHQPITRSKSIAYISESKVAPGAQQVELYPLDPVSVPIQKGGRIEGVDSLIQLQYRRGMAEIGPSLDRLKKTVAATVSSVQTYLDSPEGRQLTNDTRNFLIESKDWAQGEVADFRAKHPEFEKSLKRQIDEAKRQGNKALLHLLRELETNLEESKKE